MLKEGDKGIPASITIDKLLDTIPGLARKVAHRLPAGMRNRVASLLRSTLPGLLTKTVLGMRNRHFFGLDILAMVLIPAVALSLRLDRLDWWSDYGFVWSLFTIMALIVKVPVFLYLGLYHRFWRYANVGDLTRVLVAVFASTAVLTPAFVGAQDSLARYDLAVPRSLPVLDGMLTLLVVAGFRLGLRGLYHWHRHYRGVIGGRRVLVVGAGESGTAAVREMWANPQLELEPVAFVDDEDVKQGTRIQGLSVLGTCDQIPELVERHRIQQVIVAMPSAPLGRQREIIAVCKQTGVITHSVPGIYELLAGYKTVSRLPQIDINHLLRRDPVEIDQTEVDAALSGATVLVTGAGGSIGSELCRQVARCDPAKLILLGHGENSIFEIGLNLRLSFPTLVTVPAIADVRDQERVNRVVRECRPDVIFHAAAHKHVPFMEECVEEAITNNVLGTLNVLRAAELYGVERFVLISTDKAVNPTSVMGTTKRLAELLVRAYAQRSRRAYMAVRFGNVLGSRGSVIPVFQRQIAAGGPLTVTDPDMYRYFMTIPEAVQLVLQASVLGQGGEIFVLDMGQPVRILDLATDLIKLSGLELGRDIEIVYTGIRPGEKLNEELFLAGEYCRRTECPKIFVATDGSAIEAEMIEHMVIALVGLAKRMESQNATERVRNLLPDVCRYIDNYQPRPQLSLPKPAVTRETPQIIRIPATAPLAP